VEGIAEAKFGGEPLESGVVGLQALGGSQQSCSSAEAGLLVNQSGK
jgi:hypothetical protein